MTLGDLAWDYSEAYDGNDPTGAVPVPRMCIILTYPEPFESGRTAKVLLFDGVVKYVPVEFLLPLW